MPMYNFIEYIDNHSKTSGSLWSLNRNETALDDNGVIVDFADNATGSFNFFKKLTG